ncbi:MAG: MgtC/SapB family protein [Candidatus Magasanikbacteria bacterium]|nr:MgtC/SapB family protein [Candidatus Magasanikbacteria bacterium]
MGELYMVLHVVLAIILGGILGWQRENWGKSAGPRTYALVAGGSALFTILSVNAFGSDISRIASQIVVGIGFLGAGTILHKENKVEGLTTAAGLWMVAAIGMAVGVEYYVLASVVSLLVLGIFMLEIGEYKKNAAEKNSNKS